MNERDAIKLIGGAIPRAAGAWADIGAGDGTFTRALAALLEPGSSIHAVDRDTAAIAAIERSLAISPGVRVIPVVADFTRPFELPGLGAAKLDGMLLANTLHFVHDADEVLERLVSMLRPGGRVVIVEYDRRAASRWVPYPIPEKRVPVLAESAGLSAPVVTERRPSAFGGILYVAAADRVSRG